MTTPLTTSELQHGRPWVALPDFAVLSCQGSDAAAFLHGQLSQDVLLQTPGQGRLAAYCSVKGRVMASFWVVKAAPDQLYLVCCRDVATLMARRLSMFIMRAKAKLMDVSDAWQVHGVLGHGAPPALNANNPYPCEVISDGFRLTIAAGDQQRFLLLTRRDGAGLGGAPETPDASLEWQLQSVRSGVVLVGAPLADLFVPQMLNYESVGGVSFKKGCYPGQEIVARSQFRGTLKRRTVLLRSDAALEVGAEVSLDTNPSEACGVIVCVAQAAQRWQALACLQTAVLDSSVAGALGAALVPSSSLDASVEEPTTAARAGLTLLSLPYPLLDDI